MLHRTIKQINKLKIQFLALIVVIFFLELGMNPIELGNLIGARISSAITTMSVGVAENPHNKLALQLKTKQNELKLKEKELLIRERELKKENLFLNQKLLIVVAFGILFLFFLILLNFYLDYKRRKNEKNF